MSLFYGQGKGISSIRLHTDTEKENAGPKALVLQKGGFYSMMLSGHI